MLFNCPIRIKQILVNLISNSIKFTTKGTVTLNVSSKKKNIIRLDVIDSGCGMN